MSKEFWVHRYQTLPTHVLMNSHLTLWVHHLLLSQEYHQLQTKMQVRKLFCLHVFELMVHGSMKIDYIIMVNATTFYVRAWGLKLWCIQFLQHSTLYKLHHTLTTAGLVYLMVKWCNYMNCKQEC